MGSRELVFWLKLFNAAGQKVTRGSQFELRFVRQFGLAIRGGGQVVIKNLRVSRYRSLRDIQIGISDLNLFIGTNASGKSSILDALRFLHEGIVDRDFREAVFSRGGMNHLAWKGEYAQTIRLETQFTDEEKTYEWTLVLERAKSEFVIKEETLHEVVTGRAPTQLLRVAEGQGWWWSGARGDRVHLKQPPTICALASAAVDESFPAGCLAEFVGRWGFFDPSPFLLRRGWVGLDASIFDSHGRNLAERLFALRETSPESFDQIVVATQSVLGLPTKVDFREPRDDDGRVSFVQEEPGLRFPVHQVGTSSGTLRMLALMTALVGESQRSLIGIEEPENHVHPRALEAFSRYLRAARDRVQILVTTHSPLLLTYLDDPGSVCIVRRNENGGTFVQREEHPEDVSRALEASGFGLGEFYETTGFGG